MSAVRLLPFVLPALLMAQPALAADNHEELTEDGFRQCVAGLQDDAIAAGLPEQLVKENLAAVSLNEKVIELDRSQPEFTSSFADYYTRRVSDTRIATGRERYQELQPLLRELTRTYGIPGHYLVSFWGLETNYGGYLGYIPTLDALATLTCEGRRGEYFKGELFNALRILQAGDVDLKNMQGSWAGAMGQTQFMPAIFLRYAIDHDGDGRRNLWGSRADALASAANFLRDLGWEKEQRWGREITLPANFDYSLTGLGVKRSLAEWSKMGVRMPNGSALPAADMQASVIVPSGHNGPAFLAYQNFRVIMGWNRSVAYALAVGRLADRIAGAGELSVAPVPAPRLNREQVTLLQQTLNQLGHEAGAEDGLLGPGTRKALARYQQSKGMVADGFPDENVLTQIGVLADQD
ncbi:lytic murein transglycosylase [Alcanivorax sp. S6407]|uniref:lytic murein transglycosylase n=1 Tax=Alcanivorax sp. S6407 TaxID=2926424 RepID=UPI001FF67461|nr:lytic murein transglycosylase [Alcanivorax sp. S6407]MCK0154178.1 lytic murein transglycosylase [Alcanivorax sp. S6407]